MKPSILMSFTKNPKNQKPNKQKNTLDQLAQMSKAKTYILSNRYQFWI